MFTGKAVCLWSEISYGSICSTLDFWWTETSFGSTCSTLDCWWIETAFRSTCFTLDFWWTEISCESTCSTPDGEQKHLLGPHAPHLIAGEQKHLLGPHSVDPHSISGVQKHPLGPWMLPTDILHHLHNSDQWPDILYFTRNITCLHADQPVITRDILLSSHFPRVSLIVLLGKELHNLFLCSVDVFYDGSKSSLC